MRIKKRFFRLIITNDKKLIRLGNAHYNVTFEHTNYLTAISVQHGYIYHFKRF